MHEPDIAREARSAGHDEHDIPGMEPWLGVLLAAFVPTLALFFTPDSFRIPLYVVITIVLAASVVMLIRREIARGRR
jgi:hypothetical protein